MNIYHQVYKNNKHLEQSIISEILGYEPWLPGSYEVINNELIYNGKLISDKNQPPPHPVNIKNNTADEFRWKVYGLGLRGSMKGVIYPQLEWIDSFPKMDYIYANDFGFTNDPNALVKYTEDANNIYFELLAYQPIDNAPELAETLKALEVEPEKQIVCDSSALTKAAIIPAYLVKSFRGISTSRETVVPFGTRLLSL